MALLMVVVVVVIMEEVVVFTEEAAIAVGAVVTAAAAVTEEEAAATGVVGDSVVAVELVSSVFESTLYRRLFHCSGCCCCYAPVRTGGLGASLRAINNWSTILPTLPEFKVRKLFHAQRPLLSFRPDVFKCAFGSFQKNFCT